MNFILQQVRDFADRAHADQMRKYTPDRYIVHPERVMNLVLQSTDDPRVLSAALLHDVLEDTDTSEQEIKEFLRTPMPIPDADVTVEYIKELTDVYTKKSYPKWNRRKRRSQEADRLAIASPQAQTIKYADIIDNCPEIVREDPDFGDRYLSECKELLLKMKNGDERLRQQALETVNSIRKQPKQQRN